MVYGAVCMGAYRIKFHMIINIKVFWLPVKYRFYGFASEAQMEPTVEVCFSKTLANNSQSAWIDHEYHEAEFSILSQIIICSGWSIIVLNCEDSLFDHCSMRLASEP